MYRIPFPNTTKTYRIAYFGRCMCAMHNGVHLEDDTDADHSDEVYAGLTMRNLGLIGIAYFVKTQGVTRTTIHEFGHLFEAPDHYGELGLPSTQALIDSTGDYRFNSNCIYGEYKNTPEVADNITICEGCRARIIANISQYAH